MLSKDDNLYFLHSKTLLIFTKWTEVFSLKTRTVLGVTLQLFAGKFCCFGCANANVMLPSFGCVETVISDQGREFMNSLSDQLLAHWNKA